MRNIVALLVLWFSISASAAQWYQDDVLAESRPDIGSSKGFGAMIIMTTNSREALKNWEQPTSGVHIPKAETVEKGVPIEALIVFSGCSPNSRGGCVVEADYKILRPDGSVYAEYANTEVWRNKPAIPEGKVGLAVDRVGLIVDPEDPVGEYEVHCTVRDAVAKADFIISAGFMVVEANNKLQPTSGAPAE